MGNTQIVVIKINRSLLPVSLFCCCLFIFHTSKSQNLIFDNFSVDKGLSQNSVNNIVCDSFGLVWIATADGLNCYDGNKITQFRHNENDSNSIYNNFIYSLFICEGQDIIIQGKEGIEYFDRQTGKFRIILGITEMAEKKISGRMIGGDFSKIWIYSGRRTIIEINKFTLQKKVFSSSVIANSDVEDINIINQPTTKGQLYFYDRNKLFCFNTNNHIIQIIHRTKERGYYNFDTKEDNIYILTGDSIVCKKNGKTISASKIVALPKLNNIIDFKCDRLGNLWILSYTDGFNIIAKNYTGEYILKHYEHNISNNKLSYMSVDIAGNIWLGTDGSGAYFLNHKKLIIDNYTFTQNPLMVKSFCPITDNLLLIGTVANGLHLLDTKEKSVVQIDKLPNMDVYSLFKSNKSEVYIGTAKGVFIYDIDQHKIKPTSLPGADSIMLVKHITINSNTVYISHTNGLTRYDLLNKKRLENTFNFSNNSCQYLSFEPDNKRYFLLTEYKGIWFFDGDNFIQIVPTALKNNFYSARHIYRENNFNYWFATEKGLLKIVFENDAKTKYQSFLYTINDGLPNNFLYSVLPGTNGKLWISSNKGISEFDPIKISCVNYDINDGVQSNEFNTGAYYADQLGNMAFGGVAGLNFFNTNSLQYSKTNPNVFINELSIAGKSYKYIHIPDKIELPYNDNEIIVGFYCNDLSNPGKNKYYYLLEGLDKDWVDAQSLRQLRYAGLEPGNYILKIKTINGDGIISPEKKLTIIIQPPFWHTWWFIISIIILSLSLIIYIVQRLSNISIKRKLKELERKQEIESIRQRISSDLHDDIGSGLSKMALISELAKSQTQNPEELQNKLSRLTDNSRDMIRSLGEIVWAINPQNDKLPNLLAYMRDYASEYLETTDITINYHIQESQEAIPINPDFKRNIFLILKESLHNAVKYSGATNIEIGFTVKSIHPKGIGYIFWVSDNGKGIDPEVMRKFGQGLSSMKKRAENIGANYTIESSLGKGVRIMLEGTL